MDDVAATPNVVRTTSDEPAPVVSTQAESATEYQAACSRIHDERRANRSSKRAERVARAINFLLYGITLMIPGVAMIVTYFVVFRVPAGNARWSPADAFVITGAVLVAFSIVAEVIGVWQFCMSRYESDEPPANAGTLQNPQYSDSPPPYSALQVDLPDLVVVSISQENDVNPPSFETCVANGKPLPGIENQAMDEGDLPPPPAYAETVNRSESMKSNVFEYVNQRAESEEFTTSQSNSAFKDLS